MSKTLTLNFPNFEMAWEGINEFLANNQREITENGIGDTYGTEMTVYNTVINVERATISPDFNFGKALGYRNKKWSKLVNNYVNFDYLDTVKSEILAREKKKATSYNHVVHFDNSHGSGKDCLIALQLQRRAIKGDEYPRMIFTTRASEVTKRMIFDFLLLQRMGEYIYGKEQVIQATLFIPFMYINVESFLIYCGYKGGPKKVLQKDEKTGEYSLFQKRILERWESFTTKDPKDIKYRVHKRAAMFIQGKSGAPDLFAKDLPIIIYPPKLSPKNTEILNSGLGKSIK